MMRNPEQKIGNLIDKQGVVFIGSVDTDGFPNMKAMLPPRKREGVKEFWFTTNTSSMRVAQYRKNPKACIYFMDKRFFRGIMLKGTMEILEDAETKEMIDYGYLEGTSSIDRGGIDVWKGTNGEDIDAIICTADLVKRDSEIKILIVCNEDEKRLVLEAHNNSEYMKGILVRRNNENGYKKEI